MATKAMEQNLDELRNLLMQVPVATGFQDSIRLLEEAFADYGDPLRVFDGGDQADFHGRWLLTKLFGKDLSCVGERERGQLSPWSLPTGARRRVKKWVVVGYGASQTDGQDIPTAQLVLLHGSASEALRCEDRVSADLLPFAEQLVLRESLMNRRQAVLLAAHLNRFRRSGRHVERLKWRVVAGPDRGIPPRVWLNKFLPDSQCLRRWRGELELAGLGTQTCSSISVFRPSSGARLHDGQVFSVEGPQIRLPPRFVVEATAPQGIPELPEQCSLTFRRDAMCEQAYSLAVGAELGGALRGSTFTRAVVGRPFDAKDSSDSALREIAMRLWGDVEDGAPQGYEVPGEGPAAVYAKGLSKAEAVVALRYLRSKGYRKVTTVQCGEDGFYGGLGGWNVIVRPAPSLHRGSLRGSI
jgi:hypothetical protein